MGTLATQNAFARPTLCALLRQYLFEKCQGARVIGLAKPEECLLAHFWIALRTRYLDKFGDRLVFRQLRHSEYSFLLHFSVRIVLDCVLNGRCSLFAGLLAEPEQCL